MSPRARSAAVLAAAFAALAAWYALFAGALVDDAYIQLRYAETLATSGRWGFYPERVTNTATSPLNVVLLAALRLATGSGPAAAVLLAAACGTVVLAAARRLAAAAGAHAALPWIAVASVAASPLLGSTVGMETMPFAALLWLSCAFAAERRAAALGIAAGLLVLARPDGALLAPVWAVTLWPDRRAVRRFAVAFVLVAAPWHVVSWIWLGSAVPDTFFLKRAQTWGPGRTFVTGAWIHLRTFPAAFLASFALAPFAVAAWRAPAPLGRVARALVVFAALHWTAYALLGVPPYHWYYAPETTALAAAGAIGVTQLLARRAHVAAGAAGAALAASAWISLPGDDGAAMHTNWATSRTYRGIAADIDRLVAPGAIVEVGAEIGTLACLTHARLVNEFSDRSVIVSGTWRDTQGGLLASAFRRANGVFRDNALPWPPPAWTLRQYGASDPRAPGPPAEVTWKTTTRWAGTTRLELSRAAR